MENQADEAREQFRQKCLFEAGVTYSVASCLPVLLSFFVVLIAGGIAGEGYADTEWYRYLSYLLPQLCFCAAIAVYLHRTKVPFRSVYRGCRWYYFFIAVALQFGLFSLSKLNGYFLQFLSHLSYEQPAMSLPSLDGWRLLPAIAVIALLPAIFEETVFRGVLTRNMAESGWGTACTVVIGGAMFSLFHGNPAQTVYQFACGMCFTLVAVRSGSVLPTMISHFANNAVILALTAAGFEEMPFGTALYIVSGVCLAATLAFLIFFDKNNRRRGGVKCGKKFFLAAGAGLLVCAVQWIAVLVSGLT